ncbi:hypothetical protein Ahy_B08g093081 [Arachis hypogaea]|uniref:BHLH domain-containing protein n=2 Tax=Arachis TaxID=3817 RepID=A0A444Y5B5_ARAHY|nr:hypothetical protein Ahy_B08g093081 [Arachis hypogaea]
MTYLTYSPKGLDGECFHEQMIFVEQGIELVLLQVAFLIYRPVMRLLKSQKSPDVCWPLDDNNVANDASTEFDLVDHSGSMVLDLGSARNPISFTFTYLVPVCFRCHFIWQYGSRYLFVRCDNEPAPWIADILKALHDLLPNQAEGSQAYILDDIIDHVKYLQLQLKELSGSRLQAESTAIPLVFHEGYGHYIDQQKLNEPLEEMMGKLLEENPASASQLLENNGLVLLPMELVQDLYQSMQIFGNSNALV